MLLASQFEHSIHPLTILLTVPLAGVGLVLGLFLTDRVFGLNGARARTQQVRSALGPSVGVAAGARSIFTGNGGVGVQGLVDGYQVTAGVRKLLHDYGYTRNLVRQAMAGESAANAALTQAQSDLVLLVKQAFYAYLQDVSLVRVSEANVHNQQSHLALARAQLIGVDPRTPIEAKEESEPFAAPTGLGALTKLALQQRPEMLEAQANLDAANLSLNAARRGNAPAFYGNLGVLDRSSQLLPPSPTMGLSVSVQWTPVDSGLTAGRVKQAQAAILAAESGLATMRLAVTADVAQAYLNLATAEQRALAATAEVTNAEEALRLAEGRYRGGVGVFIEVLDAQTALDTANINRVNAQSAIDQARAALSHALGNPLPRRLRPDRPTALPGCRATGTGLCASAARRGNVNAGPGGVTRPAIPPATNPCRLLSATAATGSARLCCQFTALGGAG